ncbi:MAG: 5'/3'-nucleotidase SurE, partial [Candidatus Goldbacteria bacterium]|nr:5'/3'-nucleotidase SurE [Candidatus Goldiibacteriota bacterium]
KMKTDKRKKYIILTNDDGINSKGLKNLYLAIKDIAEILVVAPMSEKSGASHSLTVWDEIKVKKVKFEDIYAYGVYGTPADCAKIALLKLAKRKPDLLISGTNHGPNICQFVLYSGTIGAAAEGARMKIPSVSFSIDNFEPDDFSFARKVIHKIIEMIINKKIKIKNKTLLNINIPYLKEKMIKGIKIIKLGDIEYQEFYKMKKKNNILYFNHVIGKKKNSTRINTDAEALKRGFITITPIKFDFNDYESLNYLKKIKIENIW